VLANINCSYSKIPALCACPPMLVVLTDIFPSTWFAVVLSTSMHTEKFRSTISTIASPHFVRASHVLFTLSVHVYRVKPRDRVVVRRRGVQKGFDIHDTKHVCSFPASGLKVLKLFFIFFHFLIYIMGHQNLNFGRLRWGLFLASRHPRARSSLCAVSKVIFI